MRNSDAGNRSRFLDKLIYLSPGTRCEKNALKEQRLYSKGCEMTGRLPSSVVCPHNTYPSCVGVPAESVQALCHRALCRTFSHVFLREQSVLSAPFFFFCLVVCLKSHFFHTQKRWRRCCWWCFEYCEGANTGKKRDASDSWTEW